MRDVRLDPHSLLTLHLVAKGLPAPVHEHRFCARRWRFDMAWPTQMIACEVDGGTWTGGRHVRPRGYEADCEKLNEATALGWAVFRFTSAQVASGYAVALLERVLSGAAESAGACRPSAPASEPPA